MYSKGIIALSLVLVVATAALFVAQAVIRLGFEDVNAGFDARRGWEAFSAADGCMEETLWRIQLDSQYGISAGTIVLFVSNGSCNIIVTDLGSNQRRITSEAIVSAYNKTIEAEITISAAGEITMDNWQEI